MSLFLVLMIFSSCGKGFRNLEKKSVQSQQSDSYSINQEYLTIFNQYRISKGLDPLNYSVFIEEQALEHSRSMANRTSAFGHNGLARRCQRIRNRLGNLKACGEIISYGPKNSKILLREWTNSSLQNLEIRNPNYTHTAIGKYNDRDGVSYWTQILIEI